MNTRIILNLSILGLILGTLNSFGVTTGFEWAVWFVFWIVSSLVIIRFVPENRFLHLLATGFLFGFFVYIVQVAMLDAYTQNNPKFLPGLQSLDPNIRPRQFMVSMGLLISVVNAVILAAFATGIEKFRK